MVLFIILGVIVVATFILLGVLFYMLSKEGQKKEGEKVVALKDLDQIKKELSDESEIIPAFVPKVSLSRLEDQAPSEDDTYKKRVQELEDEVKAVKQKAEEQADVTREMILSLTKENQTLKNQQPDPAEDTGKLTELQTQLESSNARVHVLEEEKAQANAKLTELNNEKDETLQQELGSLRAEQTQLKQKCEDLEKTNQELQYELVKARAQSSGLERVSFNYKNQLEDFLKKANAAQETNDQLSQAKTSLEGMVEEVKLKNEELVQKDQLAQFELEKNRSRLLTLERECEELKARQQNQQ